MFVLFVRERVDEHGKRRAHTRQHRSDPQVVLLERTFALLEQHEVDGEHGGEVVDCRADGDHSRFGALHWRRL